MRLVVKRDGSTINEFRFIKGPVCIGRRSNNQICLPDSAVSKQHAIISNTEDGKWTVKDLDSANKTYLNDQAVHKAEIKTDDRLRIADFIIEINLKEDVSSDKPVRLEDTLNLEATLATPPHETIVRKPDAGHAPAMRLAAKRVTDFSHATELISKANNLDELLLTLLDITLEQFTAYHIWCALRKQTVGPMICHAGKRRDGKEVELSEIKLSEKITQAVEKGQFLVLPRVSAQVEEKERIRSAMIASVMSPAGCFGVLYIDNAMHNDHYSLSDLDYLILLSIHVAAILKNF